MTRDQLRSSIRTQLTSYTLSTAQTGFTARPSVHALRVNAYDWDNRKRVQDERTHARCDVA